jgi:hypothetical protein
MKITLTLLNEKTSTSDVTMGGVINVLNDYALRQSTFSQNLIIKNNKTSELFKLENFVTLFDENNRVLSHTGKVYNSSEGYVLISTPVQLSYEDGSQSPNVGGEILFEGDDATVRERIAYDGTVRVEIDNGKDGTIDEVEIYNAQTMTLVPNRTPVVEITFPKEIFTNTDLSVGQVNSYDPDLDEITVISTWKINDVLKSNNLSLDNSLFKKHDSLKLTVVAKDNRVGDIKSTTVNKEQEVLNSRPVITSSFSKISLLLGETKNLDYTIIDADNDTLEVTWEHAYGFDTDTIEEYLTFSDSDCTHAIQEYDTEHEIAYFDLSTYEQEDVRNALCAVAFYTANYISKCRTK